jgi:hypothetical protein
MVFRHMDVPARRREASSRPLAKTTLFAKGEEVAAGCPIFFMANYVAVFPF